MLSRSNARLSETRIDTPAQSFSFEEILRFAELAGELRAKAPKALHEAYGCARENYSMATFASELIRLGMPNSHPWLNDPRAREVAKWGLLHFYYQSCEDMFKRLIRRPTALDELTVGHEAERGLIHLAFVRYQ